MTDHLPHFKVTAPGQIREGDALALSKNEQSGAIGYLTVSKIRFAGRSGEMLRFDLKEGPLFLLTSSLMESKPLGPVYVIGRDKPSESAGIFNPRGATK